MLVDNISYSNDRQPIWKNITIWIVIFSIVISLLVLNTNNPIITVDGILYLHVAKIFQLHGLHAAFKAYNWPFYPILITWVAKLLHINLKHAAYCIDIFCITLTIVSFLSIVKKLGGTRSICCFAALLILSHPQINVMRQTMVLRDFSYWSLSLLALNYLVEFSQTHRWREAIAWGCFMSIAILFRADCILIFCFLPFSLLFLPRTTLAKRIKRLIKASSVLIFLILIIGIWILTHSNHVILKYINELAFEIRNNLFVAAHVLKQKTYLIQPIFSSFDGHSFRDSLSMLILLLPLMVLFAWWKAVGPILFLIACYGMKRHRIIPNRPGKHVVLTFIFINAIMLLLFTASHLFLDYHYAMPFSFATMLFGPFVLDNIYHHWRTRTSGILGYRWLFPIILLGVLITAWHSLYRKPYSKAYIIDAGKWLAQYISNDDKIYSNNYRVLHYAKRIYIDPRKFKILKPSASISKKYKYFAIYINHRDKTSLSYWIKLLKTNPIKAFKNSRNDQVVIFTAKPHKISGLMDSMILTT